MGRQAPTDTAAIVCSDQGMRARVHAFFFYLLTQKRLACGDRHARSFPGAARSPPLHVDDDAPLGGSINVLKDHVFPM